ncbi:hypothetical protein DPMN_127587 [Dreissena polymorpha]|uniref:Uncharacterized protein n=1 Tax=Dreissena polymorpha TaxID=45954 RepID=A0A9D4GXW7_DREPO|nr:hypothetical protein DPMN_127587 [Dreissena polymorpha]
MVGASSDLQDFTKIIYKQTNTSADITVNDKKLAEVTSLRYLRRNLVQELPWRPPRLPD